MNSSRAASAPPDQHRRGRCESGDLGTRLLRSAVALRPAENGPCRRGLAVSPESMTSGPRGERGDAEREARQGGRARCCTAAADRADSYPRPRQGCPGCLPTGQAEPPSGLPRRPCGGCARGRGFGYPRRRTERGAVRCRSDCARLGFPRPPLRAWGCIHSCRPPGQRPPPGTRGGGSRPWRGCGGAGSPHRAAGPSGATIRGCGPRSRQRPG
jgi:hypothetical protein